MGQKPGSSKEQQAHFTQQQVEYPVGDPKLLLGTVLTTSEAAEPSVIDVLIPEKLGVTVHAHKIKYKGTEDYEARKEKIEAARAEIIGKIDDQSQHSRALDSEQEALNEELIQLRENPLYVELEEKFTQLKNLEDRLRFAHDQDTTNEGEHDRKVLLAEIEAFDTDAKGLYEAHKNKVDDFKRRKKAFDEVVAALRTMLDRETASLDELVRAGRKDRISHYVLNGPEPYISEAKTFLDRLVSHLKDKVQRDDQKQADRPRDDKARVTTVSGAKKLRLDGDFVAYLNDGLERAVERSRSGFLVDEFRKATQDRFFEAVFDREVAILRSRISPDNIGELIPNKETRKRFKRTQFWELLYPDAVPDKHKKLNPEDIKKHPDFITGLMSENLPNISGGEIEITVGQVGAPIGLFRSLSAVMQPPQILAAGSHVTATAVQQTGASNDNGKGDDSNDPPLQLVPVNTSVEVRAVKESPADRKQRERNVKELKLPKLKPNSPEQALLAFSVDDHLLSIAVGASGGGKTHVALYKLLERYKRGETPNITILRPLVTTTGRDLGALPGDLQLKQAPWFKALNKTIMQVTDGMTLQACIQRGIIKLELAEYVRGETFEGDVLVDEAQNFSDRVLSDLLVRGAGEHKVILTGNIDTQIDLDTSQISSGLLYDILGYGHMKLHGVPDVATTDKAPESFGETEDERAVWANIVGQRERARQVNVKRARQAIERLAFIDFGSDTAMARGTLAADVQAMDAVIRESGLTTQLSGAFGEAKANASNGHDALLVKAQTILYGLQADAFRRYWPQCRSHYGTEMFPDVLHPDRQMPQLQPVTN